MAVKAPHARPTSPQGPADETGAKPFVKWAGGKWSLAPSIAPLLPVDLAERTYREPFLGGGALFFWLARRSAAKSYVLSDALQDLVVAYEAVRDHPNELIRALDELRQAHNAEAFYKVRDRYNEPADSPKRGSKLERASWLIYLNKTCYNGLYRTNRSGAFNVPVGRFVNPNIADRDRLLAASQALKNVTLFCATFDQLRRDARPGDVVYLDPPYVPLSRTASFDSYSGGAFGREQQKQLADLYRELDRKGCLLVLSNSDTKEVWELYKGFDIKALNAPRSISSQTTTRHAITELLIRNFERWPASARGSRRAARAPSE